MTTLHVYTNLIQVPVLLLSRDHKRLPPIPPEMFRISIDAGPLTPPVHVRREGDDAISLAVLLDVTDSQSDVLRHADDAIAALSPGLLNPQDRVSIYALDCNLVRSAHDLSLDRDHLKSAVDLSLARWTERRRKPCKHGVGLWDALSYISRDLGSTPGRRVILAVTDGDGQGSKRTWNQLTSLAQLESVAIFGLMREPSITNLNLRRPEVESPLVTVCEFSGGELSTSGERDFAAKVARILTLVRDRYILEFPRSSESVAGRHSLDVTVGKGHDYIRSAGVVFPTADPKLRADPNTLPTDESKAPVYGSRHVLTPQM